MDDSTVSKCDLCGEPVAAGTGFRDNLLTACQDCCDYACSLAAVWNAPDAATAGQESEQVQK